MGYADLPALFTAPWEKFGPGCAKPAMREAMAIIPNCALTVDVVLFAFADNEPLKILLIERGCDPFAGSWALPGGFVDEGEDSRAAAARELEEETGVRVEGLEYVRSFSAPGRDPRGRTISEAYAAVLPADSLTIRAGDDAAEAQLFVLDELPTLAFDHAEIIEAARERIRQVFMKYDQRTIRAVRKARL